MFSNYIKVAVRSFKRQKIYSAINLAGLSLGLTCFILISLWVQHEMSYDRFHEKRSRIFRILNAVDDNGFGASVSYALGPELKEKYSGIEESCRVWPWHRSLVRYQDKNFDEFHIYLTDPSFFTMFTFPFVKGNAETALADKNSIVITEETARRYFGAEDPIGKTLYLAQHESDFTVTGVVLDVPSNSHLQFDMVARVELLGEDRIRRWEEWVAPSYVQLRHGTDKNNVEQKIAGIYQPHLDYKPNYRPVLQPLTKVHLYAYGRPGLVKQVSIFSAIALFILVTACINFTNLTTARSFRRAKEIGLRKVIGSRRPQIVMQFLGESLLLSYFALGLAFAIAHSVLPIFNNFTGKELSLTKDAVTYWIFLVFAVAPLTGLLAGWYPAFHMSTYKPLETMKNIAGILKGRPQFRKILVVFQFSISIGLIIATIIVSKQLQFIREKDLGLDRHNVVTLMNNPDLISRFDTFKNELEQVQGIQSVTSAAQQPTNVGQGVNIDWEGRQGEKHFVVKYTVVDYDFFKTFKMDIIEGRPFSQAISSDATEACIINESLSKMMGKESSLGKQIYFNHPEFPESEHYVRVIGIVNDFHDESMHNTIRPFLFRIHRPFHMYVFVRIDPSAQQETIGHIRTIFERFSPGYPFQYLFLDDLYELQYRSERQLGFLFKVFGAFSIFISCLGLFGLAAYTAEQKTKEVGIRKVLGASVSSLILLL
ncbi:MAG: ABC transporter permease, partial [Candidatus Aminicenantes bacterium]|nr:ABC transporter permease [Candidatus Aminicenantes bacterium]